MTINIYFVSSEMIAEIEKVNRIQQSSGLILGSADVKSLYPNLDIDCCRSERA
jgi:hypothetical protein